MLLTISSITPPATDLGYLLHKHPAKVQSFELAFGQAHVFYLEATAERCTAALLLDIDPVGLVRGRRGGAGDFALDHYVNDRPFVASSFLSVAIAQVYRTALGGRCEARPDLAEQALPLEVTVAALPCRDGEMLLRELFEPMGYSIELTTHILDAAFPEWGLSPYLTVTLRNTTTLGNLLAHLYVLIPVLDNEKHYWVGDEELEKLLRFGEGWLATHPLRSQIATRYLKYQRSLADAALERLREEAPDLDALQESQAAEEEALEAEVAIGETAQDPALQAVDASEAAAVEVGGETREAIPAEVGARKDSRTNGDERPQSLNDQRHGTVLAVLRSVGAQRVLDLGCSEGRFLQRLLRDPRFTEIVGVDASHRALQRAADRLRLERLPEAQRRRVRLMNGALTYRDERLAGFDAAAVIEVIEHLDRPRLAAFERALFEFARPGHVLLTTPNIEYNARFETLQPGKLRHRDHRFEWTRAEFGAWAQGVAERFGYSVRFLPIGPVDAELGPPTQMAVFSR